MSVAGQDITVLGAGIAGLAVAQALAMQGAHVTVIEQAKAVREVGAGVQISPNAAVVLQALGLGAGLDAIASRATAIELRAARRGGLVLRLDLARLRPDQAYRFVHRADLIDLLAQGARAAGVVLCLDQQVQSVDLGGARPRVSFTKGGDATPKLLIGAEGLKSKTHLALHGMVAPYFTRQVAWRALIPCEPDAAAVAEVHMAAGRHLVSYPLRGGRLRNIVAVEERNHWVEEGWSQPDDPGNLQAAFQTFCPRVQGWLAKVQQTHLWGLFRHPVAAQWAKTLPDGAAVILGDAAHPTLPFLAQGAAMALEDAWVLADVLSRSDDRAAALAEFQAVRLPRCRKIVAAANGNARTYHLGGIKRVVAHAGLRVGGKLAPGFALQRFDWLYGHDVTKP